MRQFIPKNKKSKKKKTSQYVNYRYEQQSGSTHTTINNTQESTISVSGIVRIGKFKGKRISQISDINYLKWMLENLSMNSYCKSLINTQIQSLSI